MRLVDFDGDGADELLMGYIVPDSKSGVEVWSCSNGSAVCVYNGKFAQHGTNGFFPYVEVLNRSDGAGAALAVESCYGSSPVRKAYELFGYLRDGSFDALARRAFESQYETTYYICPVEVDANWHMEEWTSVSKSAYENAFTSIADGTILHLHLFETSNGPVSFCDLDSRLNDTIEGTRETISLLASSTS